MSPKHCLHLAKEPEQEQADIKNKDDEVLFTLCTKHCFYIWQNDPRNNPAESQGYDFYLSTDPDLLRDRWTKTNDKPIPPGPGGKVQYKVPSTIPGATYYAYIITVNALGFKSDPSEVVKLDGGDDGIVIG